MARTTGKSGSGGNDVSGASTIWGGRFDAGPDAIMEEINASIEFDKRLANEDIAGSTAHVRMLAKQGIVAQADADAIADGLAAVKAEIAAGDFEFKRALEDIHMNVESRLAALIGAPAGAGATRTTAGHGIFFANGAICCMKRPRPGFDLPRPTGSGKARSPRLRWPVRMVTWNDSRKGTGDDPGSCPAQTFLRPRRTPGARARDLVGRG